MLTAMSFVSIAVMVILCMRLRRHRTVAYRMWVKMMQQQCEMDRLRGLLGPNTVQIGCKADFEPQCYLKGGNEYVDTIVCKACDSLARRISKELACYIRPLVIEGMYRSKNVCAGEMHFRMPMVRGDFHAITCHIVDKLWPGRVLPVVSEVDHRRKELEEHLSVAQFKDDLAFLGDMDMKTILQNLKS